MCKTNYLFDIISINQVIEDLDLEIKFWKCKKEIDIVEFFNNSEYLECYNKYRQQFNTKECVDDLNDNIVIRYKDKDNNDSVINIVDFILDILYNNSYLSEYQMLYIIRCLNDKLSNIAFECIIDTLTDGNNVETGVINEIIEQEIY